MDTISSKCHNCGSELIFDAKTKTLMCKHCESNFVLPTQREDAIIARQYDSSFHPNQLHQALKSYRCGGCGTTYYMTSEEKSRKCPNCGNSYCDAVQDNGYAADAIIPFKITKQEASKNFKEYLKKKKSIPKELRMMAENQKLSGVFVPVWNFSYNVFGTYSAMVSDPERGYDGTYHQSYKPIFGDKIKRVKSLDKLACDCEDSKLLSLFNEDDYVDLIPFFPEYTYGYKVDKITRDIHECYNKIVSSAESNFKDDIEFELNTRRKQVEEINIETKISDVFFNFAYVPVYVNTFNYKGKLYKTYISGTTGKVVGKHPKSKLSKFLNLLKFVGVLGIIGLLVYFFLR